MRAVTDGNRCGANCQATSTKGAIVYFPPGEYMIKSPIIQYYFTVFVGHPTSKATIIGSQDFKGVALIHTDFYIPNGNSSQWWTNQNNFYRQIRNLRLDMTKMPNEVENGASGHPTGIHWQVSQACTLQNIDIIMPLAAADSRVQHRGIFMENGSGGFISDISFIGGRVGFVAGSQQYTARNLRFAGCDTAIEMLWDWGFLFKSIQIDNCRVGINAPNAKSDPETGSKQSTGSLTILDSNFRKVTQALVIGSKLQDYHPTVVIDNTLFQQVTTAIVCDSSGTVIVPGGTRRIASWATGRRYTKEFPNGKLVGGDLEAPRKDPSLTAGFFSNYLDREKPQYQNLPRADFINILDYGVKNDGSYPNDNVRKINDILEIAATINKVVVFPAGIYKVNDTIFVPPGTRMVGSLWSQIMATGKGFKDANKPKVLMKIGHQGQRGQVEISDFTFTQSGPTAGAVFIQWNIHESYQGSAAIWDTIVRVGGAAGTGLTESSCHQYGNQKLERCPASSMMMHVTGQSSVYMENMWFWVADHDVDAQAQTKINVYGARGVLIESQGPTWIHSASNEHSTLYNWQLSGARNIYLGHIQSESPYFQAGQTISEKPYYPGLQWFAQDPSFSACPSKVIGYDTCRVSWALRVIKSRNVYLYSAGFYSFFQGYQDTCAAKGNTCQDKLVDTDRSEGVWMYNVFTVGANESISPQGLSAVQRKHNMNGFATAISAWTLLANEGSEIGGTLVSEDEKADEVSVPTLQYSCDPSRRFGDLEALERSSADMPQWCRNIHVMQVLTQMLSTVLNRFDEVNNGYDALFEKYTKAFRSYMAMSLDEVMAWPAGSGLE